MHQPPPALAASLEARAPELAIAYVVTGFDGFVDDMIELVGERHDLAAYDRVETITEFGGLVTAAAGQSSLREIVVTATHAGGCAINLGDGLAGLGARVATFATVGDPVHPAFAAYAKLATLTSWGDQPGKTLAFEFADGKQMFSSVSPLALFTPDHVRAMLDDGKFLAACSNAKVIGLTNWSLYPHMTACWAVLREEVFAVLPHRPRFFFDLVDPSGRAEADIGAMLKVLASMEACGPTTLGLNQNEANIVERVLGLPPTEVSDGPSELVQAEALRTALAIDEVVIHGHRYAATASGTGSAWAQGPYCRHPVKSTGAGDRFNAGFVLGHLLALDAQSRLFTANGSSGLYVRLGRSPNFEEFVTFMAEWAAGRVAE